ncbi:MAG: hypothetical protein K9L32_14460 [Chromatiaceae bacterium]|nr:hypothetical protein [Chromatiaceae bacterium]
MPLALLGQPPLDVVSFDAEGVATSVEVNQGRTTVSGCCHCRALNPLHSPHVSRQSQRRDRVAQARR